jgi:integrase/recombinase XerD
MLAVSTERYPLTPTAETADERILAMWLHGRGPHTVRAYEHDVRRFLGWVKKSLTTVTLEDLQAYSNTLTIAPASKARQLSAIKSALTFTARIGVTPFNVGAALRLPKSTGYLAERIISEEDVHKILAAAEGRPRDHALIRLLYCCGLRISEACGLKFTAVRDDKDAGTVSVLGKGSKPRTVRMSPGTWLELQQLRPDPDFDGFVFRGRGGIALTTSAAWRVVRKAAKRAGLKAAVSPHFLRHANASHALARGCPIAVVRDTLGHSSLTITSRYVHARPDESSGNYLSV